MDGQLQANVSRKTEVPIHASIFKGILHYSQRIFSWLATVVVFEKKIELVSTINGCS